MHDVVLMCICEYFISYLVYLMQLELYFCFVFQIYYSILWIIQYGIFFKKFNQFHCFVVPLLWLHVCKLVNKSPTNHSEGLLTISNRLENIFFANFCQLRKIRPVFLWHTVGMYQLSMGQCCRSSVRPQPCKLLWQMAKYELKFSVYEACTNLCAASFLWPWPWPWRRDLETRICPRYSEDVSPEWEWGC